MLRPESSSPVQAVTSCAATFHRAVVAAKRGDGDALRYLYVRLADDVFAQLAAADVSPQLSGQAAAAVRQAFADLRGYDGQADGELVPWLVVRARGILARDRANWPRGRRSTIVSVS